MTTNQFENYAFSFHAGMMKKSEIFSKLANHQKINKSTPSISTYLQILFSEVNFFSKVTLST